MAYSDEALHEELRRRDVKASTTDPVNGER
jgi:hypothetical protein